MTDQERIIDQIRRIRNLADNAGTEGEAAAAAAMMQKLLAKYNLDLSEITVANEEKDESITHEEVPGITTKFMWRMDLLQAIASTNFCRLLQSPKGNYVTVALIIGQPHNREVVKFLFEVIEAAIVRLAKAYSTTPAYRGVMSPRTSFVKGAVEVIAERLRAESLKFRTDPANPRALVLVNQSRADIDAYVGRTWGRLGRGTGSRGGSVDYGAYAAGREAGRGVQFQRGIGSSGVGTRGLGSGKK